MNLQVNMKENFGYIIFPLTYLLFDLLDIVSNLIPIIEYIISIIFIIEIQTMNASNVH